MEETITVLSDLVEEDTSTVPSVCMAPAGTEVVPQPESIDAVMMVAAVSPAMTTDFLFFLMIYSPSFLNDNSGFLLIIQAGNASDL
jgi:hypothetical protein